MNVEREIIDLYFDEIIQSAIVLHGANQIECIEDIRQTRRKIGGLEQRERERGLSRSARDRHQLTEIVEEPRLARSHEPISVFFQSSPLARQSLPMNGIVF